MFSFYGPFLTFSGQWSCFTSFLVYSFNDFRVSMYNNPLSYFRQGKNSYIWLITTPKGLFFSFLSESENFWTFCEDTPEEHRTFLLHYHNKLNHQDFCNMSGLYACHSANNMNTRLSLFSYFCPVLTLSYLFPSINICKVDLDTKLC